MFDSILERCGYMTWVEKRRGRQTSYRSDGIQIRREPLSQDQSDRVRRPRARAPCDIERRLGLDAGQRCEGKGVLSRRRRRQRAHHAQYQSRELHFGCCLLMC